MFLKYDGRFDYKNQFGVAIFNFLILIRVSNYLLEIDEYIGL